MFVLKQFLKQLALPPMLWLMPLFLVLVFWRRTWSRKLYVTTLCLILIFHSSFIAYWIRYPLESHYKPLLNPSAMGSYDAIVVLTGGIVPAGGLVPLPTINESMFRRLDEAWRLYRLNPKPVLVSGGHVNPFTPGENENKIARDYLIRWGVPKDRIYGEDRSRDTFESALEVGKILRQKGWKRYLLVTSAVHMPRTMLAFEATAPEPIPAPGDFTLREWKMTPLSLAPSQGSAGLIASSVHEYVGLANYYWRLSLSKGL